MAKSIYDTIASTTFTVDHGSETHDFRTPEWLGAYTREIMADVEAMSELALDQGILHGLLHLGLQQAVISMRAATRPSDIKKVKQSMTADLPAGQARLDAYLPAPLKPPGAKKAVTEGDALSALRAAGFSDEAITALIASKT